MGRRGTTSAEYAILAVAIIVIVAGSIVLLGDPTNGAFIRVGGAILDGQAAPLRRGRTRGPWAGSTSGTTTTRRADTRGGAAQTGDPP